ncbi:MAG: methylenetetrahydrofolate reductase [Candidatus Melainabacteria bacterium]
MTFRDKLAAGDPVITLELSPPKGTDPGVVLRQARTLSGLVDAINVPDCQIAILKTSSMVTSHLIERETGIEAVWQLTCRDRNLIALQSDLLGGYALGLRNLLALTGDPVQLGDQKDVAKQVFHLDAIRMLDLLQQLNNGLDATGRPLKHGGTDYCVGAALNPFRVFKRAQQLRIAQKMERGVQYLQTQPVYTVEAVERMQEVLAAVAVEAGIARPPRLLVGIIPPKSADAARYMNKAIVGVDIPASLIDLLDRADDPARESLAFCTDLVQAIQPLNPDFHFMPIGMVSRMPAFLSACLGRQPVAPPTTVG